MEPCEGCTARFKNTECYVVVKDEEIKMHIYKITPDNCPCENCIVKMTCKEFCDKARLNAINFGIELDA